MTAKKGFSIEVASPYKEFWRYNVALMCGCFDAQDVRTGFVSIEDTVADVGAGLTAPPKGYSPHCRTQLETPEADHLLLYIYIVPHTLPQGSNITEIEPFPLQVHIAYDGREVLRNSYQINQWSGASIELRITADGTTGKAEVQK